MNSTITQEAIPAYFSQVLPRKKSLRFWRNIMLCCCVILSIISPKESKATLVTLGSYSITAPYYVGIYTYYSASSSETIFTPSEIGSIGTISSLAIYKDYGGTATVDSVYIYMKETSASAMPSAHAVAGYTLVYAGDIPNSASSGWMTATFPTSFTYTGSGNLSVMLVRHGGITHSDPPQYVASYSSSCSYLSSYYYTGSDYWTSWGTPSATSGSRYSTTCYRPYLQLNIDAFPSCTGTPVAGAAVASTTTACPSSSVTFSLSGSSLATDITYQWDTSSTGTGGWASAGSSTAVKGTWSFVPPGGRTLYYRCNLTCLSGGTSTSTSVSVSVSSPLTPPYSEDFESGTPGVNMPCAAALPKWDESSSLSPGDPAYWRLLSGSGGGMYTTGGGPRSGTKYLWTGYRIGSYNGYEIGYWFTPAFNLEAGSTYRFSYWYRTSEYISAYYTSTGVNFGMYYGTSNTTTSGLTAIAPDLLGKSGNTYEQNMADFTVPSSGIYYLAVKVDNKSYNYYGGGMVEDLNLLKLPDCNTATAADFSSGGKALASPGVVCNVPGTVNLSVGKTPAFSGLSFSWEVASATPSTFAAASITTASGSYTITTGGTYYFRCKVTCAATGLSAYSDTVKVITTPITPPYVEDFESGTPGVNMPCASNTSLWNSGSYWYLQGAPYASYAPGIKNHTTGGSKYLHAGYVLGTGTGSDEYWFTPGLALTAAKAYNVSFWYSNSGSGSYATTPTTIGVRAGTSQSRSAMTIEAGIDSQVYINASSSPTYDKFTRGFIAPTTGTYYVGLLVNHGNYMYYGMAIDDIGIDQLPSCSAIPSAGTAVAKPGLICSTGTSTLSLKGVSLASDLSFQWYESDASGALVTLIPGATGLSYTTPVLSSGPVYYRCVVTCNAIAAPNSGMSSLVVVNVGAILPPYIETFETATAGVNQDCASYTYSWDASKRVDYFYGWGIKDMPSSSYSPSITNRTTGGSKYLVAGYYIGEYYSGLPTGDQQYWFSPPIQLTGGGMAYKCNFWYQNNSYPYAPVTTNTGIYVGTAQNASSMVALAPDAIGVSNTDYKEMSGTFRPAASGVHYLGVKVNNTSYTGQYGFAIDDIGVVQLPLCTAKPTAGSVFGVPARICSSGSATLRLTGTTAASMISFQWLVSTGDETGPWVAVSTGSGATTDAYTTPVISATQYYRCAVICTAAASPNVDTTAVFKLNVGALDPPYIETFEGTTPGVNILCASYSYSWGYTDSWTIKGAPYTSYIEIDNHTVGGNNFLWAGYALGMYSGDDEFWWTPGINLVKDSSYQFSYWYKGQGYPYGGTGYTTGMYYGLSQDKADMVAIRPDVTNQNPSDYKQLIGRFVSSGTDVYYFGIKARHFDYMGEGFGIDDIGIEQLPLCTGAPTVGTVSVAPIMLCSAGGTVDMDMDLGGVSKVAGLSYKWFASTTGPASGFTAMSGDLSIPSFTSDPLLSTTWFYCEVTCTNTGESTTSSVLKVDVGVIIPPYIETFETATSGSNMPCASNTADWGGPNYLWYIQNDATSSYLPSAVNHTPGGDKYLMAGYALGYMWSGYSGPQYWFTPAIRFDGGKLYQFTFWYNGPSPSYTSRVGAYYGTSQDAAGMTTAFGPDFTVSGTTYKLYKKQFTPAVTGDYYIGIMVENSPSYSDPGVTIDDIGLQEVPPCSSPVDAGTIVSTPVHICAPGGSAQLDLEGSTLATGLTYSWLSATSASGPFTLTTGSGLPYYSDPLTANTWFKAIVTCTATGISDTSESFKVNVGGLSMPYAEDFESTATGEKPTCSESTDGWGQYFLWNLMGASEGGLTNHTPGGKKYLIGGYYLGYSSYTYYGYTNTDDNFWFTPGLLFDNRYKYELSFYYAAAGNTNKIGVYYGTSQAAGAMSNSIMSFRTVSGMSYQQFDTTFTPPASGTYYIGFKKTANGNYTYPGVAFDDINVNYAPCDNKPMAGVISGSVPNGTPLCLNTSVTLTDIGSTINLVPGIKYQWMRRSLSAAGSWSAVAGAKDSVLKADTLVGYEYRFAVVCGNTNDTAYSPAFQLPALPQHPPVSINPGISPVEYCLGDTIKFNATGYTAGIYDWMIDSVVVPGWKFSDMGATEPGVYMVKVTSPLSPCPAYSNKVKLIVNDPGYSVILGTPTDSFMCAGSSITLSASASKPGVTYQWRKNNINISGATGTSYVAATSGYYRVIVSDGVSSCAAASRNIKITMKPNPPAILSVPDGTTTACENEGILLNASLGGFSYEWMRGGSILAGWTDSSYRVKVSGTYMVKVRTPEGCASLSTPVTVNILPSPVPVIIKTIAGTSSVTLSTGTYISYQWMRNGLDIPGAVSNTISLTLNGIYKVRVWGTNNCEGISAPIEISETGLNINSASIKSDQIRIFPNPTQSKVFIESPISVKVSVKDVTGKEILRATETKEVDLSKFADGIYLFTISDATGNELIKNQRVTKLTEK